MPACDYIDGLDTFACAAEQLLLDHAVAPDRTLSKVPPCQTLLPRQDVLSVYRSVQVWVVPKMLTYMLKYAERQGQCDARIGRVDDGANVRLHWCG